MKCKYLECSKEIVRTSPRANNKKFCSVECRDDHYYATGKTKERWTKNNAKTSEINGRYEVGKIRCKECGRYWRFLLCHVYQKHGLDKDSYKQKYGMDKGRGLIMEDLKEIKKERVFENGTVENLKKGKKTRYRKNDPHAGRYERSKETKERLKKLHTMTLVYRNKHPL
jgi:hypothetical protein